MLTVHLVEIFLLLKLKITAVEIISFGFWSHSKRFLSAATTVKAPSENRNEELDLVAYYLIGHSIELALKAFLLSKKDYNIDKLKSQFGHNLEKLLTVAREGKLDREVKLSQEEVKAIKLLNIAYNNKNFEYMKYEEYHLPQYWYIHNVAKKLVNSLRYCSSNSPHNKKLGKKSR